MSQLQPRLQPALQAELPGLQVSSWHGSGGRAESPAPATHGCVPDALALGLTRLIGSGTICALTHVFYFLEESVTQRNPLQKRLWLLI